MRRIVFAFGAVPAAIAVATVPPDGGGGVDIVRQQATEAAIDYFSTAVEGGATHVVCETPAEDAAGVVFYCFGVDGGGGAVVAEATINDHGTAEISALGTGTTAPGPTTT